MKPSWGMVLGRQAFTLIEMLVALAITLIMIGAVVTLFGVVAESVSGARAGIEMADRLRAARNQLQLDLQGATATMKPPLRPESDEGYFEIIEGATKDSSFLANPLPIFGIPANQNLSLFGDIDDVLMFTTHSRGAPFTGKFNGTMIESRVAEVVYFLAQDVNAPPPIIDATTAPPTRLFTLYRRQFLVAPATPQIQNPAAGFYSANDLSVRFDDASGTPVLVANTLGDLTKRENRFAHYGDFDYGKFPFAVDPTGMPENSAQNWPPPVPTKANVTDWPAARPDKNAFLAPAIDARVGDDVLLTNVLAFDVQVFDIKAPIRLTNGIALEPRDPGWASGTSTPHTGAYVDLGYSPALSPPSLFSGNPAAKSGLTVRPFVYDTWSLHYENDGVLQLGTATTKAGVPIPDAITNGLDDGPPFDTPVFDASGNVIDYYDGNLVTDDITETDTLAPYLAPLRGIRITLRVYEPSSQQIREAIVVHGFLPE
jgi:prepilin-type N-terminal cleavage/methylation domain-containing protein